jgi:hypothetical protein
VKIDRHIIVGASKTAADGQIVGHAPQTAPLRQHDHLVQMWVAMNNGRCGRLHGVGQVSVGVGAPQTADERRGEDDITNESGTNQKDLQGSIVASSMSMTGMSSLIG